MSTAPDPIEPRLRFGADYRATNPYQDILYRHIGPGFSVAPAGVADAAAEAAASPAPIVYHLHWEEDVLRRVAAEEQMQAAQALISGLEAIKAAGGKIVWTRHNLIPHDAPLAPAHADLVPHLFEIADAIHVHSWPALEAALADAPAGSVDKHVVIAHPSYVGVYPEHPAAAARAALGVDAASFVFLAFGRLGVYKQVPGAAAAFAGLEADDAGLLIAGLNRDAGLDSLPEDPRIRATLGFVDPAEVGRYFAAADAVLLPYASALTSGSAHLAASLGCATIGPDLPGVREVVHHGATGLLYAPDDDQGLVRSMRIALREGRETWQARGAGARRAAKARDPRIIGRQWRDLLSRLAASGRPGVLAPTVRIT